MNTTSRSRPKCRGRRLAALRKCLALSRWPAQTRQYASCPSAIKSQTSKPYCLCSHRARQSPQSIGPPLHHGAIKGQPQKGAFFSKIMCTRLPVNCTKRQNCVFSSAWTSLGSQECMHAGASFRPTARGHLQNLDAEDRAKHARPASTCTYCSGSVPRHPQPNALNWA